MKNRNLVFSIIFCVGSLALAEVTVYFPGHPEAALAVSGVGLVPASQTLTLKGSDSVLKISGKYEDGLEADCILTKETTTQVGTTIGNLHQSLQAAIVNPKLHEVVECGDSTESLPNKGRAVEYSADHLSLTTVVK